MIPELAKLQNLVLPRGYESEALYLKSTGPLRYDRRAGTIDFARDQTVSFDTYFNTLFEAHLARLAGIHTVYLHLKLSGVFALRLARTAGFAGDQTVMREIIGEADTTVTHTVRLELERDEPLQGRLYLELTALGDGASFLEGEWCIEAKDVRRQVSIDVIICTFKRERFVKNTAAEILQSAELEGPLNRLIIVDNGKTLAPGDFPDPRVALIPQDNLGGTGGFMRGLIESLGDARSTHFLFMDDDIELDAESVYRAVTWLSIMNGEHAVAGSMLDLARKTWLWEQGCTRSDERPFWVNPIHNNRNLMNIDELDLLNKIVDSEWGAWWFLAAPKSIPERLGLAIPIFIRGDDIEFGLRLNANGVRNHPIPGIAVWHQPFSSKTITWPIYYEQRNQLIANMAYERYPAWRVVRTIVGNVASELLRYNYQSASLMLEGLKDFQAGPGSLGDPLATHQRVLEVTKANGPRIEHVPITPATLPKRNIVVAALHKLAHLATLNGHLAKREEAPVSQVVYPWDHRWDVVRGPHAAVKHPWEKHVSVYDRNPRLFWKLAGQAALSTTRLALRYPSLKREWVESFQRFKTLDAWKQYLGMRDAEPANDEEREAAAEPRR